MRIHQLVLLPACLGVLLTSGVAPAAARLIDSGTFHDEDSSVLHDFCGVSGLTVNETFTADGRFRGRTQGRDQIAYFMDNTRTTDTFTNTLTGDTITVYSPKVTTKDLKVTDNGNGTITVLVLATGPEGIWSSDGKLLGRNDGQVRFKIVYDYVNDLLLSFELVFGSTGTETDLCEVALAEWGY